MKCAAFAALSCLALCSCGGADANPGTSGLIVVSGAQFVPGSLPPASGGPAVVEAAARKGLVVPGQKDSTFAGTTELPAHAVLLQLEGDAGYWIVPTGLVDVVAPTTRTFSANITFSRDVPEGTHRMLVAAVDEASKIGVTSSYAYTVAATAVPAPTGLTFSLQWSSNSDLDLHVIMPNPEPATAAASPLVEVWAKKISTFTRPTGPARGDDMASMAPVSFLDGDSNAQCQIDGRRAENVFVPDPITPGHYVVRVDTFDMCGQASSGWVLNVFRAGTLVATSRGLAVPSDGVPVPSGTEGVQDIRPGTAGAGSLALELDF